ncbi:MAG TPA: alpha/beta hydrolase [bacterium]|nr:alpha/beta hydrolase [bacterium]
MGGSVYRSEEGREIISKAYQGHLASGLAAGLTQKMVDTPLGQTFVLQKTDPAKPPLVLLHGSVSNSASWLGVIPLYARNFSVYCLDLPGEPGLSTPERFPLSSDAPERWLRGALDALGLDAVAFVGMSLGGWYALNFAVRNPGRVSAMSLISAAGIAPQKTSFLFKALFYLMLGKKGQELLNKTIYHRVVMPKEILEYQALVSKHFRPVTEALPLFADEQLLRLTMPLQYFGGDRDALLNTRKSAARLKALLPHAEAFLLEDTGHAIVDRFADIEAFLVRHRQFYI